MVSVIRQVMDLLRSGLGVYPIVKVKLKEPRKKTGSGGKNTQKERKNGRGNGNENRRVHCILCRCRHLNTQPTVGSYYSGN